MMVIWLIYFRTCNDFCFVLWLHLLCFIFVLVIVIN